MKNSANQDVLVIFICAYDMRNFSHGLHMRIILQDFAGLRPCEFARIGAAAAVGLRQCR